METVKVSGKRSSSTMLYIILMGVLLISYLVLQACDHEQFNLPIYLAVPMILAAGLGIRLGRLWKDKGFLIMIALLIHQMVRVIVKGGDFLFSDTVSESLINGLWVIAGCYALGQVLTAKQLKTFLHLLIAIWTLGTVIQCLISLYGAWTDHEVLNLSGGSVWGIPYAYWQEYIAERLHVGYVHPTVAGSTLSLSGVVAFGAILLIRGWWKKVLYALAYIVIIVTLALTDARTSFLSLSAGVGVMVFCAILWLWRKRQETTDQATGKKRKESLSWIVAFACMVVVSLLSIVTILKIAPVFNEAKTKGGMLISSAVAEEEGEEWKKKVQSRGFNGTNLLNGRDTIWREVIRYSTANPKRLLFGESIHEPMAGPNQQFENPMAHCHNMIVQILLESGLVGLLLVICFAVYIGIKTLRIICNHSSPLWLMLIPGIVVTVLVGDMAECCGWFRQWGIPAPAFLFVAVGIINAYGDRKTVEAE